jgi:hypothetical protein
MNNREDIISTPTLAGLLVFCKAHPECGTVRDIVDEAVADWLARRASNFNVDSSLGYRWKSVFLPAGTEVRIDCLRQTFHARVIGDELIFRGEAVSPRQMLMRLTGLSGNAWEWIFVRRPGDKHFVRANALRMRVSRDNAQV